MADSPSRHPLAWPAGRARTDSWRRKSGTFKADGNAITVTVALSRLTRQLELLGAKYPLLSSNYEVRLDGSLILNRGRPTDPGVCAYFSLKGKPFALACDTFNDAAQNIAALAAHVEATRAIERYGVASAAETLQAFSALPPPIVTPRARLWREVLGFPPEFLPSVAIVRAAYRDLATTAHPDRGGSDAAMADLNAALDAALKELRP